MRPSNPKSQTERYEVIYGISGETESVASLMAEGFKPYETTIMKDGDIYFFLVEDIEDSSVKKWFAFRCD